MPEKNINEEPASIKKRVPKNKNHHPRRVIASAIIISLLLIIMPFLLFNQRFFQRDKNR